MVTSRNRGEDLAPAPDVARQLAVVLHDLAWLLPRTIGAAALRAEPIPPTALEVMRLLARRPDVSVNDVGRELGIAANNVSTALGQLEQLGLVEKARDTGDRRVVRLNLTRKAKASRDVRERSWAAAMDAALAQLSPAHRKALLRAAPALEALTAVLGGMEIT